MKRHIFLRLLLTSAACLCLSGRQVAHPAPPADEPTLPLGSTAPDFTLPDIDGQPHDLRDWAVPGQITVLNFWAFWCDTWKAEMPHLRTLAPLQKERHFQLVAISVDGTRLAEFRQQNREPTPFPVLLDGGGTISRAYLIAHVPTVVILDSAGRIRYFHVGYPGNDVVLSTIRKIASEEKKGSTAD